MRKIECGDVYVDGNSSGFIIITWADEDSEFNNEIDYLFEDGSIGACSGFQLLKDITNGRYVYMGHIDFDGFLDQAYQLRDKFGRERKAAEKNEKENNHNYS